MDVVGTHVPWYRVNGWIPQSGGPDWTRYRLVALGIPLVTTPWFYIGDINTRPIEPPKTGRV